MKKNMDIKSEVATATSEEHNSETELQWEAEEETALRQRLDWFIIPLVTLLYLLCFLDRSNIGNARIQGMEKDLALHGYRFNIAVSIFYVAYILVELPSNVILKRVGPRFFIPFLVFSFGIISLCTAFATSFEGLCVARFLLGVFEGGMMPGIAFFLSCFYRKHELAFRMSVFISGSSMAGAFGGLLAACLTKIPNWGVGSMRIHTWRNIFFFEGLLTVLVSLLAPLMMATSPADTWFLTPRQRMIAVERLKIESKAHPDEKTTMRHIRHALTSPTTLLCAAGFSLGNITIQGISVFMPTVLRDLGWNATRAQLYSVPPYVLASVVAIALGFVSDRIRRRGILIAIVSTLSIVGFALLRWETNNINVRYAAIYLVATGVFPAGPAFLSWALNNAAGPAVRSASAATVVSLGTCGGIISIWAYIPRDAPLYLTGHTINLAGQLGMLSVALFGIAYCTWENKQRASGRRDSRLEGETPEEIEFARLQLGDKDPAFRYMT